MVVIKHMTSRPKIISIETHFKAYTNPFINEISKWIKEENYRVWYKNKSDTVFVRKDVFDLSMLDRILLVMQEIRISIKKLRNQIKKQLRIERSARGNHLVSKTIAAGEECPLGQTQKKASQQ